MLKVFIASSISLSIALSAFLVAINTKKVNVVQMSGAVDTTASRPVKTKIFFNSANKINATTKNDAPSIYLVSNDAGMTARFEEWKKTALEKDYLQTNLKNIKANGKNLTTIVIDHNNKIIKYYWSISDEAMRKAHPLEKFKFISGVSWRFTNSLVYFDSNLLIHLKESLHSDFYIRKAKEALENNRGIAIEFEDVYSYSNHKILTKKPTTIKAQTWLNFKGCHYIVKEDGSTWAFSTRHRTPLDSGSSTIEEASLLKVNNKSIPICPRYANYQVKEVADLWRMQQKLTVLFQAGDEDNANEYAKLEKIFNFFENDIHASFDTKVKSNDK